MMLAASANGNGEVVMYLIDQGADYTIQKNISGCTAVSVALDEQHFEVAGRMQAAIMARCAIVPSRISGMCVT